MSRLRILMPAFVAFVGFFATLGIHYRLYGTVAPVLRQGFGGRRPKLQRRRAPVDGLVCETAAAVCTEPCGRGAAASTGYWASGRGFLGLSYALAAGFLAYVLSHFIARRREGGFKSVLAGAGVTGALWLGLCWLAGCCGSPLLPVYASLLGAKFLGVTSPLVFGLTAASVAFGVVRFHRPVAEGCCPPGEGKAAGARRTLFEKLRPWLEDERCLTCDCLQGALVQAELDGGEETAALVEPLKVPRERMHHCLGCEPCPPAEALSEYLRRQGGSMPTEPGK